MADYTDGFFYNTTTQRSDHAMKLPATTDHTLEIPLSPTKSQKTKSKKTTQAESRPKTSRKSYPSYSKPRTLAAFLPFATDPHAVYQDQLTRARTNASQKSDSKSSLTLNPSPLTTPGSSTVWVGGNATGVDRRYAPLTPEQKAQQQSSEDKLEKERALKKTASRLTGHGEAAEAYGKPGSLSSSSLSASNSSTTRVSVDPRSSEFLTDPFVKRHGRRYLRDPSLHYPLPFDLVELHRQTLRTMVMVQVFGRPICTPNFRHKPPKRVLEVGCGTGYWSSLCHQYFTRKGHAVSFTGVDIAPVAPDLSVNDMDWRFVQHDLRRMPLPFDDD
jgi:hypothetical protein